MSDYLGNLIARNLQEPALRPRLASLFEPPALPGPLTTARAAAAGEPALSEEEIQSESRPRIPRQDSSAVRENPAAPEPLRRARPEPGREPDAALLAVTPAALPSPAPSAPQARRPRTTPATELPPEVDSGEARDAETRRLFPSLSLARSPLSAPTPAAGTIARAAPADGSAGQPTFGQQSPGPQSVGREPQPAPGTLPRASAELAPLPSDAHRVTTKDVAEPQTKQTVLPAPPARREPAGEPSEPGYLPRLQPRMTVAERPPVAPHRPEAAEPTITVTIGRIEVRGTPAPAPAPRPRAAAPAAMSLDEYLRRRSRRGEG